MGLAVPIAGLGLVLLLLEARETLAGTHFLCLNFTVRSLPLPGQSWSETQCSVDGMLFLYYDRDNKKATPIGVLGEKAENTRTWKDLANNIEQIEQDLRVILFLFDFDKSLRKIPYSLQAQMCCQGEEGLCTGASWEFSVNGQTALIDTMTMRWMFVDKGLLKFKRQLDNNKIMSNYFRKVSVQDCNHWLKGFLVYWEKILDSTASSKAEETIQHYPSTWLITWIMPIITLLSYLTFC